MLVSFKQNRLPNILRGVQPCSTAGPNAIKRLVHGPQLDVPSSACLTTRWPPTEDWQCPLNTVMLACGETGPKTSAPGPQVAHPWLKVLKIKKN